MEEEGRRVCNDIMRERDRERWEERGETGAREVKGGTSGRRLHSDLQLALLLSSVQDVTEWPCCPAADAVSLLTM